MMHKDSGFPARAGLSPAHQHLSLPENIQNTPPVASAAKKGWTEEKSHLFCSKLFLPCCHRPEESRRSRRRKPCKPEKMLWRPAFDGAGKRLLALSGQPARPQARSRESRCRPSSASICSDTAGYLPDPRRASLLGPAEITSTGYIAVSLYLLLFLQKG